MSTARGRTGSSPSAWRTAGRRRSLRQRRVDRRPRRGSRAAGCAWRAVSRRPRGAVAVRAPTRPASAARRSSSRTDASRRSAPRARRPRTLGPLTSRENAAPADVSRAVHGLAGLDEALRVREVRDSSWPWKPGSSTLQATLCKEARPVRPRAGGTRRIGRGEAAAFPRRPERAAAHGLRAAGHAGQELAAAGRRAPSTRSAPRRAVVPRRRVARADQRVVKEPERSWRRSRRRSRRGAGARRRRRRRPSRPTRWTRSLGRWPGRRGPSAASHHRSGSGRGRWLAPREVGATLGDASPSSSTPCRQASAPRRAGCGPTTGRLRVGPRRADLRPDIGQQPAQGLGVRRVVEPSGEERDGVARRRVQPQRGGVDAVGDRFGMRRRCRARACPGVAVRHRDEEVVGGEVARRRSASQRRASAASATRRGPDAAWAREA